MNGELTSKQFEGEEDPKVREVVELLEVVTHTAEPNQIGNRIAEIQHQQTALATLLEIADSGSLSQAQLDQVLTQIDPLQGKVLTGWIWDKHSLFRLNLREKGKRGLFVEPRFMLAQYQTYLAREAMIISVYPEAKKILAAVSPDGIIQSQQAMPFMKFFVSEADYIINKTIHTRLAEQPEILKQILIDFPQGNLTQTLIKCFEYAKSENSDNAFRIFLLAADPEGTLDAGNTQTLQTFYQQNQEVAFSLISFIFPLHNRSQLISKIIANLESDSRATSLLHLIDIFRDRFSRDVVLKALSEPWEDLGAVVASSLMTIYSSSFSLRNMVNAEAFTPPALFNDETFLVSLTPHFPRIFLDLIALWQVKTLNQLNQLLVKVDFLTIAAAKDKDWSDKGLQLTEEEIIILFGRLPPDLSKSKFFVTLYEAELLKRKMGETFKLLLQHLQDGTPFPTHEVAGGFADPWSVLASQLITTDKNRGSFFGPRPLEPLPSTTWSNDLVSREFYVAAEMFGHRNVLRYMWRPGLSRHDALHRMSTLKAKLDLIESNLIEYQNLQGSTPTFSAANFDRRKFFHQVMSQVADDDGNYDQGSAQIEFNELIDTITFDFAEVITKAKEYPHVHLLQELVSRYEADPTLIFSSWSEFKRYCQLAKVLEESQALEALQAEANPRMRAFVEKIAFDKDSRVNLEAAMRIMSDPDALLRGDAEHVPERLFHSKKAANMTEIPHLDLSPRELFMAAIDGDLDKIKRFRSLKMEAEVVVVGDRIFTSLRELLIFTLGRRNQGIAGKGAEIFRYFRLINAELASHNTDLKTYFEGGEFPRDPRLILKVTAWAEESLRTASFTVSKMKIVTQIHAKSDPTAIILGNKTASCDNFPDGKRIAYWLNPGTGDMSLSWVRNEAQVTTLAQSLATEDLDIHTSVDKVTQQLMERDTLVFHDLIPPQILARELHTLSLDNLQVSLNYAGDKYQPLYTFMLQAFYQSYMERYAAAQGLRADQVIVGTNYTAALTDAPRVENTFAPTVPLMYSDKLTPTAAQIDLTTELDAFPGVLSFTEQEVVAASDSTFLTPNIAVLDYSDVVKIAYLEGKIYAGASSLMQYIDNLSSVLVAAAINNQAKNRPNLSLKYEDDELRGYMIAFEGKFAYSGVNELEKDSPVIYIMDLASQQGEDGRRDAHIGMGLLRGFAENYNRFYNPQTGKTPLPVYAELRESTSYRLVQPDLEGNAQGKKKKGLLTRELERICGIPFEVVEVGKQDLPEAGESMHLVIIRPVQGK